MDVLIILISVFVVLSIPQLFGKRWLTDHRKGQIAMGIMLVSTGIAHFVISREMAAMLPEAVPFRMELVYFTGVLELCFAAAFILNRLTRLVSIVYVLFLVLVLPANIYAAFHGASVGSDLMDDTNPAYLWFRIPLQLFFIWWTWFFGLRKVRQEKEGAFKSFQKRTA